MIILLGDAAVDRKRVDFESVARQICTDVGYTNDAVGLDGAKCNVIVNV